MFPCVHTWRDQHTFRIVHTYEVDKINYPNGHEVMDPFCKVYGVIAVWKV